MKQFLKPNRKKIVIFIILLYLISSLVQYSFQYFLTGNLNKEFSLFSFLVLPFVLPIFFLCMTGCCIEPNCTIAEKSGLIWFLIYLFSIYLLSCAIVRLYDNFQKKGISKIGIIIVIVVIILVIGSIIYWLPYGFQDVKVTNTIEEEIENESADWKTYRNEKYGFEVKYPDKFVVAEDSINNSVIYFSQVEYEPEIFLSVQDSPTTLLFYGTFNIVSREDAVDSTAILDSSEDVVINSINWKKEVWSLQANLKVISYYTEHKNKYYTISVGANESSYNDKEDNISQMLSTFKFIDQNRF